MKFIALLPVRDEADIIGQCLQHLLAWADAIYVFDTGSVDDTWEIVQDSSAVDRRVIPLRREAVYFSENRLRGWMFHQARQKMQTGDWFLRVDADEFHHISPPEFVQTRLRPHETIVYHQYYNFVLRESEVRNWEEGRETIADRARPIELRRQWYEVSEYSEPRLCRYRDTMRWPTTVSFPYNAGYLARERLPIRHYPHRDPDQMERRCRLRAVMMSDNQNRSHWTRPDLHHWSQSEWRKFITPDDAPGVKQWAPSSSLTEVSQTNHLPKAHVRAAQRLTHAFFLPLMDKRRTRWAEEEFPQRIPQDIVERLSKELKTGERTHG